MSKKNPGNTGHRGYRMARVTGLGFNSEAMLLSLECGHVHRWKPWEAGQSPAELLRLHTTGDNPIVIGRTRIRCNLPHGTEHDALVISAAYEPEHQARLRLACGHMIVTRWFGHPDHLVAGRVGRVVRCGLPLPGVRAHPHSGGRARLHAL